MKRINCVDKKKVEKAVSKKEFTEVFIDSGSRCDFVGFGWRIYGNIYPSKYATYLVKISESFWKSIANYDTEFTLLKLGKDGYYIGFTNVEDAMKWCSNVEIERNFV